ncbi:hypothetical protein N9N28_03945 [Rubripirellula amarantea]|uniref:Cytochrome C n=1 Tax=Rubripirellula amarantea TaxID=2527999 RepID=A0A5C5WVQ9_9BACT|nr:hypothetical protein [Rubripirellula amarantea]MDA8743769.1 hypothetical protein [Rubripirellula amarantea]TWT54640.1 hypothetical protein Pla22_22900 [Rubripirellula amarantea]
MRLFAFLSLLILSIGAPTLAQETAPPSNDADVAKEASEQLDDVWMQKKLDYSTAILKGLSLGDFELIEANARQMRLLNRIEGFVRSRNPDYRTHVHAFERASDEVIRQAKKQSIDGVIVAYHQLTVSCVRCHQTLREE